jgi:hypothetical protein
MNTNRCKKWIRRGNDILRCEMLEGHDSYHYSDDMWWPNTPRGFHFDPIFIGPLVVGTIIVAAVIFWLIYL